MGVTPPGTEAPAFPLELVERHYRRHVVTPAIPLTDEYTQPDVFNHNALCVIVDTLRSVYDDGEQTSLALSVCERVTFPDGTEGVRWHLCWGFQP